MPIESMKTLFKGVFTALITPFSNGKVDETAFRKLVEWQIAEGIHGLVPCGTTGESPTLTHDEHNRVIEICVEAAKGRVPVIAGTGSNSTDEAILMTRHAEEVGADAALIVSPYYNKPTQEGIYQHFKAIHNATKLPIIVYNIPGRSVVDIKDETMARLAELPRIVGIKDATGDLARISSLRVLLKGTPFSYLSGEDGTAVSYNAQGGNGCISVTANIAPRQCVELQEATFAGDYAKALVLHEKLVQLHQAMFCETSPSPVKYAASVLGLCAADVRLPLVQPSDAAKARVKDALEQAGIVAKSPALVKNKA
ncbi:MAG: dapA [Rickettsiales bacterium]|jgi:4-hydroxy-tetrahydrodipicolinate synthase|nr:dapA [Rickettsiales bacterium]